jgi:hypothetical protein
MEREVSNGTDPLDVPSVADAPEGTPPTERVTLVPDEPVTCTDTTPDWPLARVRALGETEREKPSAWTVLHPISHISKRATIRYLAADFNYHVATDDVKRCERERRAFKPHQTHSSVLSTERSQE